MTESSELAVITKPTNSTTAAVMFGPEIDQKQQEVQSQRTNRELTRITRKRLVVPRADPEQPLTPLMQVAPVKGYSARQSAGEVLGAVGVLGGGLTAVSLIFTSVAFLSGHGAGALGGGEVLLGSVAGFAAYARIVLKFDKEDSEVARLAAARLTTWMKDRYDLEVDPAKLSFTMSLFASEPKRVSQSGLSDRLFTDKAGDQYILAQNPQGLLYVERYEPFVEKKKRKKAKKQVPASRELAATAGLKPKPYAVFEGEAALLFTQVEELLVKLEGRELRGEQQHAVKRVVEDLRMLDELNQKLHALTGPTPADQQNFVTTLSTLRAEMFFILEQEQKLVSSDVAAQTQYVQQRRLGPVSPLLNLKKSIED